MHGQVQRAAQREGAAAIGVGGKPIECPVLIHVSDDETHKDDGMPLPDAPGAPKSHWFKKPRLPSPVLLQLQKTESKKIQNSKSHFSNNLD